jgi:hypothetical protein
LEKILKAYQEQIDTLRRRVDRLERNQVTLSAGSGWIPVSSFEGTWENAGSPFDSVAYRKINGAVQLRGVIAAGTSSAVAFILPTGYRPNSPKSFIVPNNNSAILGSVEIATDGAVYVYSNASPEFAYLDGIEFIYE